MTPSKILFLAGISFILGVGLQAAFEIPHILLWGFLLLAVISVGTAFFFKKEFLILGLCILCLVLGIARFQMAQFAIAIDPVAKLNDRPEKITVKGTIVADPDIRERSQKLKVAVDTTDSVILITTNRYVEYHYLDKLKLVGKLEAPFITEDFNYQYYLWKDRVYSVMDFPSISIVKAAASAKSSGEPQQKEYTVSTFLYEKLLQFKHGLSASMQFMFPVPQHYLVEGVILGNTSLMPQTLKDAFRDTGLIHITAISGSNVVILSAILMTFLIGLGLWRQQAFYGSVVFIWLYIIIAGLPSSGVRAAIMATAFLLAQQLGRQHASGRIVVLTAAVMLLENPMLLPYDIGFQLSFLASMGIIYLKPVIDVWLGPLRKPYLALLLDIFSITVAAQVATLPMIMYYFKSVSLVSLLTNILVIPIIDWVMVFGFLAALVGMFFVPLGIIISFSVRALLAYFFLVLSIFNQPWAAVSVPQLSWIWVAGYYGVLIVALWWVNRKVKQTLFESV